MSKSSQQRDERGAILLTVLIVLSIMAIMMSSYMKLSFYTMKQSDRVFYRVAAYNLAESGLEHALWALHDSQEGISSWAAWDAWTLDSDTATLKIDDFRLEGEVVGVVNIAIIGYESSSPVVVSKATITAPNGMVVEKYIYASLNSDGSRGSLFKFGMLARNSISATGGATFDSWISDPDNDDSTPAIPYSSSVARDNSSVASASTSVAAISLGSSNLYGTASVGSDSEYGLIVGWGGQVGPRDPVEWDSADTTDLWLVDGRKVSHSTGAITTSLAASFEEIIAPDMDAFWPAYVLPYNHQVPNKNGNGTHNEYVSEGTIGTSGVSTTIEMSSLSLSGGSSLTIQGDVTLVLTHPGDGALSVIQGAGLELGDGATLTIYTPGNIEISGAGFIHEGAPKQVQIWGTNSESQRIEFSGSGSINGIIYAPNADVTLPGGTDFYGAIVGNNITMSGSGSFHYDESLKDLSGFGITGSQSGSLSLDYMTELNSLSEWSQYESLMNF